MDTKIAKESDGMGTKHSEQYDVLRLDNQLCFALYAANRVMTKTYRERLDAIGITYPQYLVLLTLWERDGLTISEIGNALLLDSGTITPLVKRLESMGIIRRERVSDDERKVSVFLEDKGRTLIEQALKARLHVATRLGMTEDEISELRGDLMKLINRLFPEVAELN